MKRIAYITFAVLAMSLGGSAAPAHAGASRGAALDDIERAVVRELNAVRSDHGLRRLRVARPLSRAADRHTQDMLRADFFDHPSSDGTPFHLRVRSFTNAGTVGETLGRLNMRDGGAAEIVDMWLESAPHRAIVLTPQFRRVGVGRRWGALGRSQQALFTADFAD